MGWRNRDRGSDKWWCPCTMPLSQVQTGFFTPISPLHPSLSLPKPFHPSIPPHYFHFYLSSVNLYPLTCIPQKGELAKEAGMKSLMEGLSHNLSQWWDSGTVENSWNRREGDETSRVKGLIRRGGGWGREDHGLIKLKMYGKGMETYKKGLWMAQTDFLAWVDNVYPADIGY